MLKFSFTAMLFDVDVTNADNCFSNKVLNPSTFDKVFLELLDLCYRWMRN